MLQVECHGQHPLDVRVEALVATGARLPLPRLAAELEAIRRLARAEGFAPAVTVIHALDAALARGEHGARIRQGLEILRDAIGCGRRDAEADDAFAALCAVRLNG